MTWTMPPETAPQDRIWMAYPPHGSEVTTTASATEEARSAWSAVAHAALDFEAVTMVVDPADVADARRRLSSGIELVEAPLDDAWMRDIGPTFVHGPDGAQAAVTWTFNGWGQQQDAGRDRLVGAEVAAAAGVPTVPSRLVNEGGGIHVDGLGTVLVTETVQLDPRRNPGWTRADVEAELARTIGATHAVWLPRGLYRDAKRYGTRGHVDIVATIPSPGRLLVHVQRDPAHPDHAITQDLLRTLRDSADATGCAWEIVEIPAPRVLRDPIEGGEVDWVDYSYVNHLVLNGGVIACGFGDRHDESARAILAEEYAGREVVAVEARPIFARGGGIHCITQQQPSRP